MGNPLLRGHAPKFTVNITKDHIENGVARNSNHCMIAEAVKEARPELSHVCVDIQTIRGTDRERGVRYIWITPRSAQQLIIDYDMGKVPKPCRMVLRSGQTIEQTKRSLQDKKKAREWARSYAKTRKNRNKQKAAQLKKHSRGNALPSIHGGTAPPRSIGARRAFGLRSLAV